MMDEENRRDRHHERMRRMCLRPWLRVSDEMQIDPRWSTVMKCLMEDLAEGFAAAMDRTMLNERNSRNYAIRTAKAKEKVKPDAS